VQKSAQKSRTMTAIYEKKFEFHAIIQQIITVHHDNFCSRFFFKPNNVIKFATRNITKMKFRRIF
jgi:hypothetical protein